MNKIRVLEDRLRSYFYDFVQGSYPFDETPTFEEWFDDLSNSEMLVYLSISLDLCLEEGLL